MLRTCLSQVARIVSSSPASSCARPNVAALLHTTSMINAELARRTGSYDPKKANTLIKKEKRRKALEMRPHVVLGHRPGDEAKWQNCDLAKILVSEEELQPGVIQSSDTAQLPVHLNFGIGGTEKQLLFHELPQLSAEAIVLANPNRNPETLASVLEDGHEKELFKLNHFAKVVDLRNANARGIAYENRRRIILAFSSPENPYDTGRTEVQAALLTYRIRNLYSHLTNFRRDVGNRRGLRTLVHQRAKILRYLKRTERQRYDAILERLGLEPESVEGELIL